MTSNSVCYPGLDKSCFYLFGNYKDGDSALLNVFNDFSQKGNDPWKLKQKMGHNNGGFKVGIFSSIASNKFGNVTF